MTKRDPIAALRAMGVTMESVERRPPPKLPKRKATPKKVVADVRAALARYQGLSAGSIAYVLVPEVREYVAGMCGSSGVGHFPCDPDDFSRCRRIVALIHNGTARLAEVAAAFPHKAQWLRLAAAWPELEALFVEESKRKERSAPKLYARMQELTR